MTAIVGILNKKGVAIAADSASTTKKKIINSGNKMLRISDVIPAAVMVVNNSTLATMPWEVIIRWYRKENGKSKFPSLQSCIDDFLAFVDKRVLNIDGIPDEYCEFDEEVTTNLVFAGYGDNKLMYKPNKGFDLMSDDKEVTIYAQGQPEIIKSYIHGVVDSHVDKLINGHITILKESIQRLSYEYLPEEEALLLDVNAMPTNSFRKRLASVIDKCKEESEKEWLDSIKDYNLQKMASLAENLIKATELRKKIMNEAEEVGGLIDLAIICKNDGFQWLNRKSWYDPSRGGQYGKFGI